MPSRARGSPTWFAIAAVVGFVVALGACDGSDSDRAADDDSSSGDQFASTGIDADRQAPAAPIEGAVEGGVVNASSGYAMTSLGAGATFNRPGLLDPTNVYEYWAMPIMSGLVTRSLTQYVYDPDTESMVLVPDIATDIGTPNDDFTEWTYTIRDGVRFEDGTEVTADDVAYGILRSFDHKTFRYGPSYSTEYFLGGHTYKGPYRSGTDYEGVVVDGDTLTLKMAQPFPDMPYYAAFPAMGPIPVTGSNPDEYAVHPLATGPYKFATYEPGTSLTLVRNDEWDPATDPGRHAYPDEYHFTFGLGESVAEVDDAILADTEPGQTSVRWFTDPTIGTMDQTVVDQHPDLVTLGADPCVYFLSLDMRKITDLNVRKAVGYAYPFDDIVTARGGIVGVTSEPWRTLLPPGFPGRVDYNPLSTPLGETDPNQAQALLKQAGYEPGEFVLRFSYIQDAAGEAYRDALTAGLEAGGFTVEAQGSANGDIHYHRVIDPDGPYNLRGGGWCADWPSGSEWLPPTLTSKSSDANRAHFHVRAVVDEVERIQQLPLQEQAAAWGALDEMVATDYYPYVVTDYRVNVVLHGSRIEGLNHDTITGMPTWKDAYVAS